MKKIGEKVFQVYFGIGVAAMGLLAVLVIFSVIARYFFSLRWKELFIWHGIKYVGVAGKQISQGMEIPMKYMYGIMPLSGAICALCIVIKIVEFVTADVSYFAPKNQVLTKETP